jgi:hypothetical protein
MYQRRASALFFRIVAYLDARTEGLNYFCDKTISLEGHMPVIDIEISKKKLLLIIVIIALIVGAVTVTLVILNTRANWAGVASWNGQETEYSMTTEPFTINGTEWRVNWQVGGYDNSSRCYVSVYDANTNGLIVELPHEQQSGETHFNSKGTFYLKISLHGALQAWSVQVFQTT